MRQGLNQLFLTLNKSSDNSFESPCAQALRGRNLKPGVFYCWDEPYYTKMLPDENPFQDCTFHLFSVLQFYKHHASKCTQTSLLKPKVYEDALHSASKHMSLWL